MNGNDEDESEYGDCEEGKSPLDMVLEILGVREVQKQQVYFYVGGLLIYISPERLYVDHTVLILKSNDFRLQGKTYHCNTSRCENKFNNT